ncbi:unnamed protein product [Peniophora sp. CBMAI 1063]|nr:unnamed protein product [Peniophora sp. CBMAI 1063]
MGLYDQLQAVLTGTSLLSTFLTAGPTVDLGYATYAATNASLTPGVTSFLGIRYAAPPTGELRFSAPQAPSTVSTGVQESLMPPTCWGGVAFGMSTEPTYHAAGGKAVDVPPIGELSDPDNSSEDCLFVNVHVPQSLDVAGNASAPVLVWFHPGAYIVGGNRVYPTENLVRNAPGDLIVVSVQYRLGPFGFLAGQTVKEGGALNAGLLDQELALKWVQEHIAKFGGDANRVAIYGTSAGAGSVLQHIVAHNGDTQPPLFHAAMLGSTFLPSQYSWDDPSVETAYQTLANQVNCTGADTLECLRAVDAPTLALAGIRATYAPFLGGFAFVPVVDGELITERPYEILKGKTVNGALAFVMGNGDEGFVFAPESIVASLTVQSYIKGLFPGLDSHDFEEATRLYSHPEVTATAQIAVQIYADTVFNCPGYAVLDAFDGANKPAWKGLFAAPPAWHGDDLIYTFESENLGLGVTKVPESDLRLAHTMRQAILGVATSSDPNAAAMTSQWPKYNAAEREEMLFNRTEDGTGSYAEVMKTDEGQLQRCEFWRRLSAKMAQ